MPITDSDSKAVAFTRPFVGGLKIDVNGLGSVAFAEGTMTPAALAPVSTERYSRQ
ncbi:hypothetical protein [Erwinia tracheiphila]|uniref:hypothetical protein n=1 Tax=Erwinia tracheiphila TaxID=65700 RepID=UPI0003A551EA|nr:hypothetical protein [Erwinia tracheiphila]